MSKESLTHLDSRVEFQATMNSAAVEIANGGTITDVSFDNGVGTFTSGRIVYKDKKANTTNGVSYVFNLGERFGNISSGDTLFSHIIDINTYILLAVGATSFSIYLQSSSGNYRFNSYTKNVFNNFNDLIITIGSSLDVKVYRQGVEITNTSSSDVGSPVDFKVNDFQLGSTVGGTADLSIDIDSVYIYNKALSAGEVSALAKNILYTPSTDGLVLNLDSRQGMPIDKSGNPIVDQIAITMKRNGSIYNTFFTQASHSRISMGKPDCINNIFVGGGTWEAWINPYSDGENDLGTIFSKSYVSFRTVGETAGKCKLQFKIYFDGTNGEWITTNTEVNIREWAHVSVTYNSDNVANVPVIEVNNVGVAIDIITTPTSTVKNDAGWYLYIGDNSYQAHAFDGLQNMHKIYNTARTAEDKARNYVSSKQKYGY